MPRFGGSLVSVPSSLSLVPTLPACGFYPMSAEARLGPKAAGRSTDEPRASMTRRRTPKLVGREQESRALDNFLDDVRNGESRVMVVHGEAGVGKTSLLEYVSGRASDCRVVAVAAVEAEKELPFATLHQLCAHSLDRLQLLPAPQRDALEVTFGIGTGPAPERLLVGLAVLGLLSELAAERPLVCLVDDAHWLDRASAQVVGFVARHLRAQPVALVVGTRDPGPELAGLPDLAVAPLKEKDARVLVASVLTGPVDRRVLDQLVGETHGNPMAVVELQSGLKARQFAGGFEVPVPEGSPGSIEESFRRRVEKLPPEAQRLLLLAAADPLGDPLLLWRAAERLGIPAGAGQTAVDDELVSFDSRVRFRHPLARSAVYRSASVEAKREAHAALAEATDAAIDPERQAWHRAQAVAGPDEEIAAELERYAERARARGGLAAAAAFLQRAALLSPEPARRAVRALAAGQAKAQLGAHAAAADMIAIAESGPLGELDRARLDLVRAQLAFATNRGSQAPRLLLKAAQRLEPIDVDLARATYLDALMAAHLAVSFAGPDADVPAVARAAGAAPPPGHPPAPPDLLLDGLAANYNQSYAAGLPLVRAAVTADSAAMPLDQELRWLSVASRAAMHIWDDDRALAHSARFVRLARETGALSELTFAIDDRALLLLLSGEPGPAASAVEEAYANAEVLGTNMVPWGAMGVAAWRGDEAQAMALVHACKDSATARGEGGALAGAAWAEAVLNNGLGRYPKALAAAQLATDWLDQGVFGLSCWLLGELIEAAARSGMNGAAAEAHRQLGEMAGASGTDWALGVQAYALALKAPDEGAEQLYRASLDHLGATRLKAYLARAHLLFGEWLRRQQRRVEARAELNTALEMLEAMGMDGFAERARRELRATGETARKRTVETQGQLTAQESQVAKLAAEGLSNPEIAACLFISARTVQYHLGKVFTKLAITSRTQLDRVRY